MVRCDVLTFGDFVAKSGRRTPYFVNAGRYRTGAQVAELGRFYAELVVETFGDDVDVLFGPAYKGIPLAVTTAIALAEHHGRDVGFCFDRKEAKDHGEGGQLVGAQLRDGDRVVVVEDVTTAGTSIRTTLPLLRAAADVEVLGLVVGVDRRERGSRTDVTALDELAAEYGLQVAALATVDDLVEHLRDREVDGRRVLGNDDLDRLAAYRATYGVG
ncbi:orotate phosphoribosyltransferase [Egicoccus halophilus]|uniref:Orotate phosphoribosyltransferase n=1 Tax=Egicoccus halophilus TaxID=1670830 RepID=A0A8J3A9B5_9ACTN|nr:orotate phosphoribosyltransferase [Egicoccus halophilus]GGI07433.1 orotate phosphoribosyltransferase [Egicoccus halophilus]